ncbi:NAD(P)H-dependent oxidoreductase [Leptobacterium sp. I13]|uniref:NADPH-dependent FMN reductase n=1 Tax=Leptobacterium meishanense TaxID=3128904 RepID=UPI0030EF6C95
MKTILAFAGSNSSSSINYRLVSYTTSLIENYDVQLLNMINYPFPMYSEDLEKEKGFPNSLIELHRDIRAAHALVISVNEHNGNPSAYFKNLVDWLSRFDRGFLADKKVFLMSTSPGKRGGIGSKAVVENMMVRMGATVEETYSLPSFHQKFSLQDNKIIDGQLASEFRDTVNSFITKISS